MQKTGTEEIQMWVWLNGRDDQLRTVQTIKFNHIYKEYKYKPKSVPEIEVDKIL